MLRADVDGAIWLTDDDEEGRFYERLAHPAGRVVPSPSVAIQVLKHAEDRGAQGLVATVRGAERLELGRENVFCPSLGDTASLLVISDSCLRVLEEICGSPWLRSCEREVGPLRNRMVAVACFLEKLSQACADENVPAFSLPDDLSGIFRWDSLDLAWDRISAALALNGLSTTALERTRSLTFGSDLAADMHECDGMDVVELLAAATKFFRPRGIAANRTVGAGELISMLRVAFDLEELDREPMFWRMKRWERQNYRYPLLKHWRKLDPLGVVTDQRYWEGDLAHLLQCLGANEHMAIFKIDLDNFGNINNALGHTAGDEALRLYCSVVKRVLGKFGEIYRRGGDEVVAVAPGLDAESAQMLGEEVRAGIESEFRAWGRQRALADFPTASIGVVLVEGGRSFGEVVALMDDAEREAKQIGKNQVVYRQ